MRPKKRAIDEERDTALELPDLYFEDHKPGFKPTERKGKAAGKGDHHFPRITREKDVPQVPLARRIRRPTVRR